jgi:hypothetical protein
MSKQAKPDDATKLGVWLSPEDRQRLRELRAALAGEISQPSESDVVRFALRELHAARIPRKDEK